MPQIPIVLEQSVFGFVLLRLFWSVLGRITRIKWDGPIKTIELHVREKLHIVVQQL